MSSLQKAGGVAALLMPVTWVVAIVVFWAYWGVFNKRATRRNQSTIT